MQVGSPDGAGHWSAVARKTTHWLLTEPGSHRLTGLQRHRAFGKERREHKLPSLKAQ